MASKKKNSPESSAELSEVDAEVLNDEENVPKIKLSKELKGAARDMGSSEARHLVDTYYQRQDARIRTAAQLRAVEQGSDTTEPASVEFLRWLLDHDTAVEAQVKLGLSHFAKNHPMGPWLLAIKGVGPVMTAGLVSHLDIHKAPTCGHFWNFAGLNPAAKWEKGERRPWNASLKKLLFLIGESFVKCQGRENAHYSDWFAERKAEEVARNDKGEFVAQCADKTYDKGTEAWPWVNGCYPAGSCRKIQGLPLDARSKILKEAKLPPGKGQPMLPPAHIHARARRWTVKLFLSHFHAEWFRKEFGREAPLPYAIDILKHAHMIHPK